MRLTKQIAYARKVLPGATARALNSPVRGPVHLVMALADHFEPSIVPEDGRTRAPRPEQERRLEWWVHEYPKVVDRWRDRDGRPSSILTSIPRSSTTKACSRCWRIIATPAGEKSRFICTTE